LGNQLNTRLAWQEHRTRSKAIGVIILIAWSSKDGLYKNLADKLIKVINKDKNGAKIAHYIPVVFAKLKLT